MLDVISLLNAPAPWDMHGAAAPLPPDFAAILALWPGTAADFFKTSGPADEALRAGKFQAPGLVFGDAGEHADLAPATLSALQAEARLVDFLLEDISGAPDAAVGAGVREVHKKAAATLRKYLVVESVLGGSEGDRVTVPKGFNPSAIRVLGNVTGEPPFTGELQHAGWTVRELKLPGIAEGQDPFVLQPAEVQM